MPRLVDPETGRGIRAGALGRIQSVSSANEARPRQQTMAVKWVRREDLSDQGGAELRRRLSAMPVHESSSRPRLLADGASPTTLTKAERTGQSGRSPKGLWMDVMSTAPRFFPSLPLMPRALRIAKTRTRRRLRAASTSPWRSGRRASCVTSDIAALQTGLKLPFIRVPGRRFESTVESPKTTFAPPGARVQRLADGIDTPRSHVEPFHMRLPFRGDPPSASLVGGSEDRSSSRREPLR